MEKEFNVRPVTLTGDFVRLEPLAEHHAADLFRASQDDDIWLYMPHPRPDNLEQVRMIIRESIEDSRRGFALPFAIVHLETRRAVGSTRYLDIQPPNRSLEIGWTWIGTEYQRTAVNTESKYLLLRHALETQGAVRVQLKTDERNIRSQKAIERLGAVREGVLRKHRLTWDGVYRNTVYYSILDTEWPEVRERLEGWLQPPQLSD